MSKGVFVISLDFELHWGGFEKWPIKTYEAYFLNTRRVIPEMLSLFVAHKVHVTWATVGMLFYDSEKALIQGFPDLKPSYKIQELSAYQYINEAGIGKNEQEDPFHFSKSLIQ